MRIMIADANRKRLADIETKFKTDPRLRVAGCFENLTACYHAVEHRPPAIVLVAPSLASLPDFEVMQQLFRALSVRWMLIGNATELRSSVRWVGASVPMLDSDKESRELSQLVLSSLVNTGNSGDFRHAPRSETWDRLFLIGSSTGGVDALMTLLSNFPADCPPTMIVQHTGEGFSAGLARLLDNNCQASVREAGDGDLLERGTIFLAPSGRSHLRLDMTHGPKCRLVEGPAVSGHRPSVDVMYKSAVPIAKRCTAVILTGMGRDGADGLLSLRQAGARTIGQDEATSMVYGMPKAAFEAGAVGEQLPLVSICLAMLQPTTERAI
ncbi:CheB methylesterase domain-containing protein [Donghicola mangrovi]|uniref:protein-glutamate methylesterase n=1 Tax=Donghicola mangrovi TaxID=2729614 RepID=A0A850Q8Q6_9RHOB|nr:CheB methylesterase domain-containing protein [Donghicola mangrovi]NVO23130.1 chemotaxis protein CheB [Donghicola mangrovi]